MKLTLCERVPINCLTLFYSLPAIVPRRTHNGLYIALSGVYTQVCQKYLFIEVTLFCQKYPFIEVTLLCKKYPFIRPNIVVFI